MSGLRFRAVRETALIGALVGVFVLGTQAAAARQALIRHELDALGYALLVAAACVLAGRARWPRATVAAVLVLVGTYLVIGYPYGPVLLAVSIAVYAVVDRSPIQQALWVTLIALVALALPQLLGADPANPLGDATVLLAESGWLVLAPAALAIIRHRNRETRDAERRRLLAEERLMLAREVHDIVAHNLSMASIQAGAALKVIGRDPEQAKTALRLIHRTNQDSLADLRRTIDVLRAPAGTGPPAPAGPGLARLDGLIETVEATGISAQLLIEGTPGAVPPRVELAAYRIVQESLTNVIRHAGARHVSVRVRYTSTELTVEIRDDGTALPGPPATGAGLVGMRERAEAAGGQLDWGPAPGGGFQVIARLPAGAS